MKGRIKEEKPISQDTKYKTKLYKCRHLRTLRDVKKNYGVFVMNVIYRVNYLLNITSKSSIELLRCCDTLIRRKEGLDSVSNF